MLRKFARIKWLLEAITLLAAARFLIEFVPLRRWRGMVQEHGHTPSDKSAEALTERQVSLAQTTGLWVKRATIKAPFEAVCLPQAMAARWMRKRRGIPSQLFVGARRNAETSALDLHAWLICGGEYVTGKEEGEAFQTFQRT